MVSKGLGSFLIAELMTLIIVCRYWCSGHLSVSLSCVWITVTDNFPDSLLFLTLALPLWYPCSRRHCPYLPMFYHGCGLVKSNLHKLVMHVEAKLGSGATASSHEVDVPSDGCKAPLRSPAASGMAQCWKLILLRNTERNRNLVSNQWSHGAVVLWRVFQSTAQTEIKVSWRENRRYMADICLLANR